MSTHKSITMKKLKTLASIQATVIITETGLEYGITTATVLVLIIMAIVYAGLNDINLRWNASQTVNG